MIVNCATALTIPSLFIIISIGRKLWVSVDETTDVEGRHVGAVVVRTLEDQPSRPYLMQIVDLDRTNAVTIYHAVDDSIRLLGDAVRREDVLVMVTDAAAYMILAGVFSLN